MISKKTIIPLCITLLCIPMIITCSLSYWYYTSFVWAYYEPDSLSLSCYDKNTFSIEFSVSDEEWCCNHVSQESKGVEKEKFDSLCKRYDDFGYNKKHGGPDGNYIPNHFFSIDLKSITVTSDVDFDEAHPAGTPLNDITWFAAISPVKYIRSGYSKKCHWYKEIKKSSNLMKKYVFHGDTKTRPSEYFPVDKRLSECTEDDFELLMGRTNVSDYEVGRIGWLQLLQQPAAENYTIIVEIVDSRDSVWRASANTANSEKFYW